MKTAWLKHTGRWAIRLLKIAGVAVALVLAFQVLVLPWVVRRAVASSFAGMGLSEVSFQVRGASFWQTELAQVRVGNQGLARVGNIGVGYSPSSLLKGRVETIWLNGAEVEMTVKDGRVDLGPLAVKRSSGSGGELPFDRLELRASTLALQWEGRRLWVPMEGTLVNQGRGRNQLDAVLRIQGGQVHVVGGFDPATDRVDFTAEADDLAAAALAAGVPARYAGRVPSVSAGTVSLKAHYVRTPRDTRLIASTSGRGVRFGASIGEHRAWVQDLDWTASVELDGGFNLVDAKATANARRISFDGEAATNVAVQAEKENQRLVFSVNARGEDWLLRKLKATVGGLFGANPEKAYAADVSIGLDAKIPEPLANLLLIRRMDVSALGAISANGQFKAGARRAADGGWAWEASTQQMLVQLSPGSLSINKDAIVLRKLSGAVRISGQADNQRAEVSIMPGSSLWVGSMEQKLWPIKIQKGEDRALAALAIDAAPAQFSVRFDNPNEPWTVHVPDASLTVPELAVSAAGGRIRGLATAIRFRANAMPSQVEVFVGDGSVVGFESLEVALGGDTLRAGPWKVDVASRHSEPLVHMSAAQTGGLPRVSFHAQSENALLLKSKAVEAAIGSVAVGGTMQVDADGEPAVVATVSIGDGSAEYKPGPVRIGGVLAVIPVTWNAASEQRGELTISSIQLRDIVYPAAKGAIRVAGTHAEVQMDWPFIKDVARIMVQGSVEFGGKEPRGQITGTVPAFVLKDEKALPGLIKELKDFGISGTVASKLSITFEGGDIKPLVWLTMKDVNIASKEYHRSLEGINGTVVVDSFSPLSTPGGQRLTVRQANTGKLQFTEGVLTFRIENSSVFHVEGTDWGWAGGRVYLNSFRLDLNKPQIDLTVSGDKLSLAEIVDMFGKEHFTGDGSLYGRLPVYLIWPQTKKDGQAVTEWSQPALEFGEGFVYATPGGGNLHVVAPAATIGAMLEKQNPDFAPGGKMETVKSSLMGALKDFRYSVLMVDLLKEDNSLMARLHMSGVGANGQEIGGLTVNIRGFDAILRNVISIRREMAFGE